MASARKTRPAASSKKTSRERPTARRRSHRVRTLSVDIGGTGIKMLVLDERGQPVNERARQLTPKPAKPEPIVALLQEMFRQQPHFDRISVGFPGIVQHGVTIDAPNLSNECWSGYELEATLRRLTGRPVRVINDADLQGYGVILGRGVEMVVTLGTGMGAALFTNGHLVPNLELGHHPFRNGRTYEDDVCDAELKRIGKARWTRRVVSAIAQLEPIFNYDLLHLGGGNVGHVQTKLPQNVRIFEPVAGLMGGIRLWQDQAV